MDLPLVNELHDRSIQIKKIVWRNRRILYHFLIGQEDSQLRSIQYPFLIVVLKRVGVFERDRLLPFDREGSRRCSWIHRDNLRLKNKSGYENGNPSNFFHKNGSSLENLKPQKVTSNFRPAPGQSLVRTRTASTASNGTTASKNSLPVTAPSCTRRPVTARTVPVISWPERRRTMTRLPF